MVPLESHIILRAFLGSVLAGFLTGLAGVFVVKMRLTSLGYCMSHGAFAGAALGVALSVNPLATALLLASATAVLIGPVADKARLPADVVTSIAFPVNLALAFIFFASNPELGLKGDVASILWGSIITLSNSDLVYLSALAAASSAYIYLVWKELSAIMFDRRLAEAEGVRVKPILYSMIFLTGLVVTLSLKLVGGLLVFALIFNPAATSLQLFDDIVRVVVFSPILGASSCLLGLILSLTIDLPVGACIVLASTIIFALSVLVSPRRRVRLR